MKEENTFNNGDQKPLVLTMDLIRSVVSSPKVGERLYIRPPDSIICRNEKEVEMAKRLINNQLTKEEEATFKRVLFGE